MKNRDVVCGNVGEYHGFQAGDEVVAWTDSLRRKRIVVAIGGLRKCDNIQLDSEKSPFELASDFKLAI